MSLTAGGTATELAEGLFALDGESIATSRLITIVGAESDLDCVVFLATEIASSGSAVED